MKSLAFEGQPIFIGSRLHGRNVSSPYNWPTTNSTPVHERKAAARIGSQFFSWPGA